MNWDYEKLPGCEIHEKNNQVSFPYNGANCNHANDKDAEAVVGTPPPSLL